jgi:hypothetical protein
MDECRLGSLMYKITSLKFMEPSDGEEKIREECAAIRAELADKIRALEEEMR